MSNEVGRPHKALIVGGTSEIGLAICRRLADWNPSIEITLAGRSLESLNSAAIVLSQQSQVHRPSVVKLDLTNVREVATTIEQIWEKCEFDLIVLTAGVLPELNNDSSNVNVAINAALVNFVGQLAAGTVALRHFDQRGSGFLLVISSVAAERIRPENYVYGATKAGLDGWAVGAALARKDSRVRVLVVRSGMVRTRMTTGYPNQPFTTDVDHIASVAVKHLMRGSIIVWSPAFLKFVMRVLRLLPNWAYFALTRFNAKK